MAFIRVTTLTERGTVYTIYVDPDRGTFHAVPGDAAATWDNSVAAGATLEEMQKRLKVKAAQRTIKVAVPFCVVRNYKVVRGVARGIHNRSKNLLVTFEGDVKEELGGHRDILCDLTPQEEAELNSLGEQVRLAKVVYDVAHKPYQAKLDEYTRSRYESNSRRKPRLMDLNDEVVKAIEAKVVAEEASDRAKQGFGPVVIGGETNGEG